MSKKWPWTGDQEQGWEQALGYCWSRDKGLGRLRDWLTRVLTSYMPKLWTHCFSTGRCPRKLFSDTAAASEHRQQKVMM